MSKPNEVESFFGAFVLDFGGELVPEDGDNKSADYLFRRQNIIAELKCLMVDQTGEMERKVKAIAIKAVKADPTLLETHGHERLAIATAPKAIQDPWVKILTTPIENVIRDANRQIRATKTQLGLPSAKGLVLIFNQGNPLHDKPRDFRWLLAKVLRKKMPEGLRFQHVDGVVYFSYETIKTGPEGLQFWAPVIKQVEPDDDTEQMGLFQIELRDAWFAHVGRVTGKPVRVIQLE